MEPFVPDWSYAPVEVAREDGGRGGVETTIGNGPSSKSSATTEPDGRRGIAALAISDADDYEYNAVGGIEITQSPRGTLRIRDGTTNAKSIEDIVVVGRGGRGGRDEGIDDDDAEHDDDDDDPERQCRYWSALAAGKEEVGGGGEDVAPSSLSSSSSSSPASCANDDNFGDIWSTEAFFGTGGGGCGDPFSSPLRDMLDSGEYSLLDLLGQDELLQELRGCEPRLLGYFTGEGREEVAAALVECLQIDDGYGGCGRERWCARERERREGRRPGGARRNNSSPIATAVAEATAQSSAAGARGVQSPPAIGTWSCDEEVVEGSTRTPEDEYNLRFVRYPYMACEVLCSDVGQGGDVTLLNALVDGYFVDDEIVDDEVIIVDESDSMLDDRGYLGEGGGVEEGGEEKEDGAAASSSVDDNDNDAFRLHRNRRPPPLLHKRIPRKRRVLDLLFGVLVDAPTSSLDDRRAGYLERVLNLLFAKRGQAMCEYMNTASIVASGGISIGKRRNVITIAVDPDAALGDLGSPLSIATEIVATTEVSANDVGASYTDLPGNRSYDAGDYSASLDGVVDGDCYPDVDGDPTTTRKAAVPNDAPPVLMCALFDHLHSHSIMHIVQRLLLPSPTRRQATAAGQKWENIAKHDNHNKIHRTGANDNGADEDTSGENNPRFSEINNRFINTLSAMNTEEDEEDDVEPVNDIFQCDWSMLKTNQVLELLLKRLGGDTSSFLVSYGHLVGYDAPCCAHVNGKRMKNGTSIVTKTDDRHLEKKEESHIAAKEATLLSSQHASEILIAIIQNSSLDSPFMISLSSDPALQRILDLVMPTSLSSSSEIKEPEFVAHESIMTCAITVLECLVLQLGGYGAVAASSLGATDVGDDDGQKVSSFASFANKTGPRMTDYDLDLKKHLSPSATQLSTPSVANATTLLRHVNALLVRLSELLTHPITETWVELSQYSNGRPRTLLGASRLCIVRLVESLVLLGNPAVDMAFQSSDCLEKCLDLFWQFEWCSMLHQSAANMLVHVFEGGVSRMGLQKYFLVRCNLLRRLMDSFIDVVGENITGSTAETDANGPSKEEREALDQRIEEDIIESPRLPQYVEATVAVSTLSTAKCDYHGCQNNYGAIGEDEVDSIAPVSEDDVDSLMEKESQEGINDLSPKDRNEDGGANTPESFTHNFPPATPQGGLSNQIYFRKGNMGHVIIICQALVHACNNTVSHNLGQRGDDNVVIIKQTGESSLSFPASLDDNSITSSFETSAIHAKTHSHDDDFACSNFKKRKDRSPVRDGEDIKRLASSPSSNNSEDLPTCHAMLESEITSSPEVSQAPIDHESNSLRKSPLPIEDILRQHPLFGKWQSFVTSVLASEMSVQSTPLGSQLATNKPNAAVSSAINENFGSDFLGIDDDGPSPFQGSGLFGGIVVGEIDMDENDLDIAASMMEALRVGHNRHRPSFGGGGSILENETIGSGKSPRGIANFGSVIQQPGGFQDYVYDDPLGQVHLFESDDSNDEDDGNFNCTSKISFDEDCLMSDAMVVSSDGGMTNLHSRHNGNMAKSESSSSDEVYDDEDDDDDDDDDVPVMDLFAGSFDPSFADFDAMASDCNPFDPVEANSGFGNSDIAGDAGYKSGDDFFQFSKTPLLVDSLLSDPED
ncbi:hypothetical protein ACHAXA_001967 [Cyclostephanos tholiformis]|uniref:Uncharacterized protein n=1 Tax=Cyclostephanos tholiformis TaxID=382380 RepID=A0ABD3RRQ9_9STRA